VIVIIVKILVNNRNVELLHQFIEKNNVINIKEFD